MATKFSLGLVYGWIYVPPPLCAFEELGSSFFGQACKWAMNSLLKCTSHKAVEVSESLHHGADAPRMPY